MWESIRAEAERRGGASFDLRGFHRRALRMGGMGLDTLRGALLPADRGTEGLAVGGNG